MTDLSPIIPGLETDAPLYVAGPCSAESRSQLIETAQALRTAGVTVFRAGIWKPRTMPGGFDGVGEKGLEWLAEVKSLTGMLTATEVATRDHVMAALGSGVDVLWIGARTSANPFAVQEIADAIQEFGSDVAVLVKNPVNPDIELWIGALQRIYNVGVRRLGAIHRGFSAYGEQFYRNAPIWRIALEMMRRYPHLPLLCDPSHIGGRRELIEPLARQAMNMGFDGLIIESHCRPDEALSDSAQQITPSQLSDILNTLNVGSGVPSQESMRLFRQEIDSLDAQLLEILGRRMQVSRNIAAFKKIHNLPVVQTDRYDEIMKSRMSHAATLDLREDFVRNLMASIHEESVRAQLGILDHP